jgi:hypothetical protein
VCNTKPTRLAYQGVAYLAGVVREERGQKKRSKKNGNTNAVGYARRGSGLHKEDGATAL